MKYIEGDCILCPKCKIHKVKVRKNSQGQLVIRCPACRLGFKDMNR